MQSKHRHIAIFASGRGTNAVKIVQYFQQYDYISFTIFSNRPTASILEKAKTLKLPTVIFSEQELKEGKVLNLLKQSSTNLVVLAGFLLLIPVHLLEAFPKKIINIHPALLPAYGGKGMYGMQVHKAVIEAGEKQSGLTIHYVNEYYDQGQHILQKKCSVNTNDTPQKLAEKIQKLEHKYYPRVVAQLLGIEKGLIFF